MQFFHFKEIPLAFFPTMNSTLLHCPRANNNPSLASPSLDQTQLLQSTCSSSSTGLCSEAASFKQLEGPLAGPGPFVFDGQRRQTVIGGL